MTCPLPTPAQRRQAVAKLIDRTSAAERIRLRARLYLETPAVGPLEEAGREPKRRCAVCWTVRPARLKWKDCEGSPSYICGHAGCWQLWRRLKRAEETMLARVHGWIVESDDEGKSA